MNTDLDSKDEAGELRQMVLPTWLHNAAPPLVHCIFCAPAGRWRRSRRSSWCCWSRVPGMPQSASKPMANGCTVSLSNTMSNALEAKENHYGFIGFYPVMLVAGFLVDFCRAGADRNDAPLDGQGSLAAGLFARGLLDRRVCMPV